MMDGADEVEHDVEGVHEDAEEADVEDGGEHLIEASH